MMYAEQRNWEASFTEKWFWTKAQFDMLQRLHAISLSGNREQWMTLSWLCFAFCQCCLWGLWPCSVVCSLLPNHPVHHITWTTLTTALDNQRVLDSSVKYITCENWPRLMNSWHCWHDATFTIQLLSKVILAF